MCNEICNRNYISIPFLKLFCIKINTAGLFRVAVYTARNILVTSGVTFKFLFGGSLVENCHYNKSLPTLYALKNTKFNYET